MTKNNAGNKEIEVRFLEIDKAELIKKLQELNARDLGEEKLEEIVFYDKDLQWKNTGKFIRLRKNNLITILSYKHHLENGLDGTEEIEFEVSNFTKAEEFLVRLGFIPFRHQQKIRRTFEFGETIVDIDTWPKIPTYVELESNNEANLKKTAKQLNLDWSEVVFEDARTIIETKYGIPVGNMKWFTFERFE